MFWVGACAVALIGALSLILLESWEAIQKESDKVFKNNSEPGFAPGKPLLYEVLVQPSPWKMFWDGCGLILGHGFLFLVVVAAIGVIVWVTPKSEAPDEVLSGAFFAMLEGFFGILGYKNLKEIKRRFLEIIYSHFPIFIKEPDKVRHTVASTPILPPFTVITNNTAEIVGRVLYTLVLAFLIYVTTLIFL